ncbi:MAG: hypothetical protein RLZZ383_1105 [Pseudomonadota bacterium]
MRAERLLLAHLALRQRDDADRVWLRQPMGDGRARTWTWGEAIAEALSMARHLQGLGVGDGDRVGLLSKNCAWSILAELAIWFAGGATVSIFPTETAATIGFVLDDADVRALFVGKLDDWNGQRTGVSPRLRRIRFPLAPSGDDDGATWDEIVAATPPLATIPERPRDALCMIVYTSGSTGTPKGVRHTFGNASDAVEGLVRAVGYRPDDRQLSYLPLAHIFERAYVQCASFVSGHEIHFAASVETFVDDLRRARPTLFVSVPRLWLKFQQGVVATVPDVWLRRLWRLPWVGPRIKAAILRKLGLDEVRMAASGSAPIPASLLEWYNELGVPLLEGYAMSEDFGYSHFSTLANRAPGWVGVPYPGVTARLDDDGEILIQSPGLFAGYHGRPDLDAEAFTPDGFFRTGDLGVRREDGMLRLCGRKKEPFKTSKGKFVAPAPIEDRLLADGGFESVCVLGAGRPAALGIAVPSEDLRAKLTGAGGPVEALRARLTDRWAAHLVAVNAHLPKHEQLSHLVVRSEPWSVQAGTLTPTLKLKRAAIEADAAPHLDAWTSATARVVWATARPRDAERSQP